MDKSLNLTNSPFFNWIKVFLELILSKILRSVKTPSVLFFAEEKLNNKNFRNKAPEKIIEKFEADHEDLMAQLNKQKALLESLEKIDN